MMKTALFKTALVAWSLALLASWAPPVAGAIDFADVRQFEEVFVISGEAPSRDLIEVRWDIEPDYYLYNNRFLGFKAATEGVILGEPQLPKGKIEFDELLGEEVEKYTGRVTVSLPLESVPPGVQAVQLNVRSQGCLEGELCYPPSNQVLLVSLPPADSGVFDSVAVEPLAEPATADSILGGPGANSDLFAPGGKAQALQPEEAFVFESIGFNAEQVLVRFTAQPGYYLYVDKFEFRLADADGFSIREIQLPEGVIKDDPEFGPVPVYFGLVEIPILLNRPSGPAQTITLEADFQGCRDGDICYPPMSRVVSFEMPAAAEDIGSGATAPVAAPAPKRAETVTVSDQDRLARLLTANPAKAILAFFVAGLLLAFTPCVFPMVPILSGIIVGQGDKLTTMRSFWLSLVYVLAMAVTYTVAGVLAGLFGQNLQAVFQNPWILSGFVLVFIALALSMFGFFELQLPSSLQTRLTATSNRQQSGQWGGVAVMGFLSALIVGPCVAPPLMAALIVIGSTGDAVLGGTALFALAMGMGVPLILFGVSAGKLVPKAGAWMDAVKAVFGVGLLALAIWMLERILPGGVIMLLWGALAIACAVYLGALDSIPEGASGWRKLWKSLGVLLLVLGILELAGAAAGGDYWLEPLDPFKGGAVSHESADHVAFAPIKSSADLDAAVAAAAASGKGAMLDFYADWCVECKRMERNTFPAPEVAQRLEQLQPLQADVTANDDVDQVLMKRFGVIGPPAILFFDRNGNELEDLRLVGYFEPEEFAAHLDRFLARR